MKKVLTLILTVLLVVSLAACGGKDPAPAPANDAPLSRDDGAAQQPEKEAKPAETEATKPETQPQQTDTPPAPETAADIEVDLDAITSGNGDTSTIWAKQDEATRQKFAEAVEEDGAEVTFGTDGTTTIKDANGEVYVQNPDGTWTYVEDRTQGAMNFGWPDNELTRLVPAPDFTVSVAQTEGNEFTAAFSDPTLDQIKAYVEKVKEAGFTVDASVQDTVLGSITVYSYSASNADGAEVEIVYTNSTSGMTITK